MTAAQVRFIYKVAGILKTPAIKYLAEVRKINNLGGGEDIDDNIGAARRPLSLVDLDSTFVSSEVILRNTDTLWDMKPFVKTELYDAIRWTHDNVKFNGVVSFQILDRLMVGLLLTPDWLAPSGRPHWSGIYLLGEEHSFAFIRVQEFFKR